MIVNCKCAFKWYFDFDGDDRYSKIDETYVPISPGPKYKTSSLGFDCNDSNPNIYKLNKCAKCDLEPVNGDCKIPCKTSKEDLKLLFPDLSDDKAIKIADLLNKYAERYGINTKEKLQHFLAQAGVETDNFNAFIEDSGYRPKRVMEKFSQYFNAIGSDNVDPDKVNLSSIYTTGNDFVDGKKFFNIVYDDRNPIRDRDNLLGNKEDGDGYNFRARGAIHLTGREKYKLFSDFYNSISGSVPKDFTQTPDDLNNNFDIAIQAGLWFFQKYVLSAINLKFQENATSTDPAKAKKFIKKVSKIVNGGKFGMKEREDLLIDAKTKIKCN